MLKIEAVFLNFFEFFLWLMAMLIVRVWVFECEAPPLSVLYYSMYNNFFSLIIIRAPWLSQYVRRFSCCRPGFKSRRGRFLVTQSDRPTFLDLTCSILGEGDFWLPNQIVLRLGLDLTDV